MDRQSLGMQAAWNQLTRGNRETICAVLLVLGFAVTAAVGAIVVRYPSGAPADWMATSFLVCALLLLSGRRRIVAAVACLAIALIISLAIGLALRKGVILTVLCGAEALMAAVLVRRVLGIPRLFNMMQALRLVTLVVLPTALV